MAAPSAAPVTVAPAGVPPVPPATAAQAAPLPGGAVPDNTVVSLIRSLVQEGVLTQDRATTLIRQAQDEAVIKARSTPAPVVTASSPGAVARPAPAPGTAGEAPPVEIASAAPPSIRVPYIPEIVRRQIRDEVKQEVIQQAIVENWATPNAIPEWTQRFEFSGDFRARYEWDIFDERNSPFFPDFQSLNDGAPFDLNNPAGTSPPLLNTTESRHRARIRARLGITANITDNFTAGFRLATGNTTNPVTTNQNLGTTLNKNNFLLDRAYIEYRPLEQATLWVGRFASPWMSNELVWDDDLNFDGVAAQARAAVNRNLTLTSTVGAFPVETTLFNAPDNTSIKQDSRNKWLYGAQGVLGWRPTSQFELQYGMAYYRFDAIQGALSTPCVALSAADPCSTDLSRPGFLQQGNTLFAIRDLVPVTANPPVFQYYGLATPFRLYNLTARIDAALFSPWHVIVDGEYVINTAFNRGRIAAKNPVNNLGPSPDGGITPGTFDGGNVAWQGRFTFGHPRLVNRWDWNVSAAYRYVESDSLVDAFTDSDFHLGGTNTKGYIIGAGLGLARNVNLNARWLSASEITGAPYSVDVVLVDLNAQF